MLDCAPFVGHEEHLALLVAEAVAAELRQLELLAVRLKSVSGVTAAPPPSALITPKPLA